MMLKWFRSNWLCVLRYVLGLLIAVVVFWGFIILYKEDNWIGISALATLLLAMAAFWAISENRYTRKEDREKERKARSAEELCNWAEEALRLRYLPYNYHYKDIAEGLIGLTTKNMLMIIAAEIIGDAFIEPTKKAEEALTNYRNMIRDRVYQKKRISPQTIETLKIELEGALYPLLTYLYVLRYWDYDYKRFLNDAIENGKLKPKYKLLDGGDIENLDKEHKNNDMVKSDSNNQNPSLFKPLPWGVVFFSFWASLRIIENPTVMIQRISWFYLGLSAILLLAVFTKPLLPFMQKIITKHSPLISKVLTIENVNGFFAALVFLTTLLGFPLAIIMSWSNLSVTDVSISIFGLALWMIAYILVLVSIISRIDRVGRILGLLISILFFWGAINNFTSNALASWILIGLGVIFIIVIIVRPKYWSLEQVF